MHFHYGQQPVLATGTENNWTLGTAWSMLPKFFGYWLAIQTLAIQDLQCWAGFSDVYTNAAPFPVAIFKAHVTGLK